ncbi:MAG: hypothetical protein J5873_00305 [Bacteroidales bacterium]|nr:hypothetical protein [Bacteroidales bacterium]
MYIYKFRLLYDEVEGFVRDFEIGAKQTFKDFHLAILDSIKGLNPQELASFYLCDRKWNKLKEITLVDMESEVEAFANAADDENEDTQDQYLVTEKTTMENAVLSQFINDPHQRIIYEQDFLHLHTFYIELIKSMEGKEGKTYPVCTHSSGELPKPVNIKEDTGFQDFLEENEDEEDELFYDEEDLEGLSTDLDEAMDLL